MTSSKSLVFQSIAYGDVFHDVKYGDDTCLFVIDTEITSVYLNDIYVHNKVLYWTTLNKAAGCNSNADCPDGCCYINNVIPLGKCFSVSDELQPCHLPSHHVNLIMYPCGCASGSRCLTYYYQTFIFWKMLFSFCNCIFPLKYKANWIHMP